MDDKPLKTCALLRHLPDTIENLVYLSSTDRIVSTSVVIGGVFLARDELFGVKELAVGARTNLICRRTKLINCLCRVAYMYMVGNVKNRGIYAVNATSEKADKLVPADYILHSIRTHSCKVYTCTFHTHYHAASN